MMNRKCLEALDTTFRDILSIDDPSLASIPFGGKIVVLGGDLRQILPVIEGGTRTQIIDATIMLSPLWHYVKILHLTINMRLAAASSEINTANNRALFSQWLLDLGNGTLPTTM